MRILPYASIAKELNLPKSTVKKGLMTPSALPKDLRDRILNAAYRQGETWIAQEFPTHALVLFSRKEGAYVSEVAIALRKRLGEDSVRVCRYDSAEAALLEADALRELAPTCVYSFGVAPEALVAGLSKRQLRVLYFDCPKAPRKDRFRIDYYTGTAALTAKLFRDEGYHVYFASHFQDDLPANEKLLGYLSVFPMADPAETQEWIFNLDRGYPSADRMKPKSAVLTTSYATAQYLRQLLPECLIACVDLMTCIPDTPSMRYATVLPEDFAARFAQGMADRLTGNLGDPVQLSLY